MFLMITIITSIPAYADDYKYIPPTAPENWREMSHRERVNYMNQYIRDPETGKYYAWFSSDVNPQFVNNLYIPLMKKSDDIVLNSPNVIDNKNFLMFYKQSLDENQNVKAFASLHPYIMFYDYNYFYEVCEGIRKVQLSDFYESFPITDPDYTPPETLKSREEILSVLSSSDNTDNTGDNTGNEGGDNSDNNDGNNNDSGGNNDNENINIDTNTEGCNCGSALNEIYKRLGEVKDILAENSDRYNQYEHNIDDIYKAISENGYQKKSLEATENIMVALYDIKALLETGAVSDNAISENAADYYDRMEKENKRYDNIIKAISENAINQINAISENRQALSSNYVLLKELKDNDFNDIKYALFACALGIWGLLGFHLEQTIFKRLRS